MSEREPRRAPRAFHRHRPQGMVLQVQRGAAETWPGPAKQFGLRAGRVLRVLDPTPSPPRDAMPGSMWGRGGRAAGQRTSGEKLGRGILIRASAPSAVRTPLTRREPQAEDAVRRAAEGAPRGIGLG